MIYSIDFTIQLSDGTILLDQTFYCVARNITNASLILKDDLSILSDHLPADKYVIYDLAKIYCNGKK